MSKRIWITWESQRRNRELSNALGAELIELKEIDCIKGMIQKYSVGLWKTARVLFRKRASLVFCQNPSLVLAFVLVHIKSVTGFKVVVDAHNAGLFPMEGKSAFLMTISRLVQRHADFVIVTNKRLQQHVSANHGKSFVLPDKIPSIPDHTTSRVLDGKVNLLFICSYAEDEPYQQVFDAAKDLPHGILIYVTGNYKKKEIDPDKVSESIRLTGFVSDEEYESLLYAVDGTIDLTERENCLVCGAYESVAVEKPMILSDTKALREYFYTGAVYTKHTTKAIRQSIFDFVASQGELDMQVKKLKVACQEDWERRKEKLEDLLQSL